MLSRPITATVSLLLALGLLFAAVGLRGQAARIRESIVQDEDRFYLPPVEWMRAFCLGYNEAAADFLWATTLVYFGGKKHWVSTDDDEDTEAPRFTVSYLSLVTNLDPRFVGAYRDGGRLTLYHTGRITRESVEMAIALLEKGRRHFPDDGDIAFNLGFLHYYEMEPFLPKDEDAKERRFHKEEGTHLLRLASTMDGAPPYASVLAGTLLHREGFDELVAEHLRAMLVTETNPMIRRSLEAQLARALGDLAARDIEATKALHDRWKEELPFVPFDVFLLIQPQRPVTAEELVHPELDEPLLEDAGPEGP